MYVGFSHLCVFLCEYCLHLSNMALPITLHSSLLLDLTDEYGLYENKTKQTLQEPEGQFLRGYGNMVSVAIKMSCGPQLGLLLFCHLFNICQSQVFTSYVFVTREALACCYCVALTPWESFMKHLK